MPLVLLALGGGFAGSTQAGCYNIASITLPDDGGTSSSSGGSSSGASSSGGSSSGGSSSGSSSGSTGGPFCATLSPAPTFCEDFDETNADSFPNWPITNNQSPWGSYAISTAQAASGTNSFFVKTLQVPQATGDIEIDLGRPFQYAGQAIQISMAFDIWVDQWDTGTGHIIAAEIIFDAQDGSHDFTQVAVDLYSLGTSGIVGKLVQNAEFSSPDAGSTGGSAPFLTHPLTKTWVKLELDLTVTTPNGTDGNTATIKLGGTTVVDAFPLPASLQGGLPTAYLGVGTVDTTAAESPWNVYYDNFAMNISPLQ